MNDTITIGELVLVSVVCIFVYALVKTILETIKDIKNK